MANNSTSDPSQGPEAGTNPLSESERKYLETGGLGSYTHSNIVERIESKMNELPDRINSLHRDVELISKGDPNAYGVDADPSARSDPKFFTMDRWGGGWLELMGFEDEQTSKTELIQALQHHPPAGKSPRSAPADFGMKLGQLARRLMLCPNLPDGTITPKQIYQEVVWGFVRGCYLDNLQAFAPREHWYEAGDELATMIEHRTQEMGDLKANQRKDIQSSVESIQRLPEILEHIDKILKDNGLQGDWLKERIKNLMLEHYDIEELLSRDEPVSELFPETEVIELVEKHQIEQHHVLRKHLISDVDQLRSQSYQGLNAETVFETIFSSAPKSNREIRNELDLQARDTRPAKIAKDLTGRGWDSVPLLTETEDGWQLTDYGRALGHIMRETEKPKLARDDLPTELVTEALVEWSSSEASAPID